MLGVGKIQKVIRSDFVESVLVKNIKNIGLKYNLLIASLIRFGGAFAALALIFLISKNLPKSDAGIFFISSATATLISLICKLGSDELGLKHASLYMQTRDKMNEKYLLSIFNFAFLSLLITSGIVYLLIMHSTFLSSIKSTYLWPITVQIIAIGMNIHLGEILKGLGRPNIGLFLVTLLPNLVFAALFLILQIESIHIIILLHSGVYLTCALISYYYACKTLEISLLSFNNYQISRTFFEGIPILISTLFYRGIFSFIPMSIFGLYNLTVQAADFTVISRIAISVTFFQNAVNSVYSRKFARRSIKLSKKALESDAVEASKISFFSGAVIAFTLLILSENILYFFNTFTIINLFCLKIMIIAQMLVICCGPVTMLMNYTGMQKTSRNYSILVLAAFLLIVFINGDVDILLICATAALSFVVLSVLLCLHIRLMEGISSSFIMSFIRTMRS